MMEHKQDTDEELIIAIVKSNYISYNKLFRRYYIRLCRYVYSIVEDTNDAEDIVQELFLTIWDNRKKLDIHENLSGYLCKMARNMALNHIRKNTNYRITLEQQAKNLPAYIEDNTLETEEFQNTLYECIDQLPGRCKEILLLHRVENLKQKEIAEKLNISVKTIKNQIWIALQKLKNCLQLKGIE